MILAPNNFRVRKKREKMILVEGRLLKSYVVSSARVLGVVKSTENNQKPVTVADIGQRDHEKKGVFRIPKIWISGQRKTQSRSKLLNTSNIIVLGSLVIATSNLDLAGFSTGHCLKTARNGHKLKAIRPQMWTFTLQSELERYFRSNQNLLIFLLRLFKLKITCVLKWDDSLNIANDTKKLHFSFLCDNIRISSLTPWFLCTVHTINSQTLHTFLPKHSTYISYTTVQSIFS